jgi:hypothetical protein
MLMHILWMPMHEVVDADIVDADAAAWTPLYKVGKVESNQPTIHGRDRSYGQEQQGPWY